MRLAEGSVAAPQGRSSPGVALHEVMRSARFWVYAACSIVALVTSYLFGKDLMWDTLAYHLYAGFSALHDRFNQDYFAAGTQSYFNPYVYVPYYLLARSGLSALAVSSVLALAQSGILWLTYELALSVSPVQGQHARTAFAVCAVVLAFANPILIDQIGTSYVDILTAELVLAGWLMLVGAVRAPGFARIAAAGLLLGVVSALKLTNSVHAIAACAILLFIPAGYAARARYTLVFGTAVAIGFLVVMAPWSIHLEKHFGNPLFPLFNGMFRSPQFPIASLQDHRFIPDSLADALWRPFAIAAPVTMTDDEFAAPDLRYAIVVALSVAVLLRWLWRRRRRVDAVVGCSPSNGRKFIALGCAFLLDWTLWLAASGIGRYFIAMACVAGILGVGLVFQLFATRPKVAYYLLALIVGAQAFELSAGATYRGYVPWDGGRSFELSIPKKLTRTPYLYLTFGEKSVSFLAPFVSPKSGFVNLDGDYVLGPRGAGGAHLRALIARYAPRVRVLLFAARLGTHPGVGMPEAAHVNDTLAHLGLKAAGGDCLTVAIKDVARPFIDVSPASLPIHIANLGGGKIRVPVSPNRDLVTCGVVPDDESHAAQFAGDRTADLVFDRVEDACPRLFQPRRPVTEDYGDERKGFHWLRRYGNTGLALMITNGAIKLFDPVRGGTPIYLGMASTWEVAPQQLVCGRRNEHYYAKVVSAAARPAD